MKACARDLTTWVYLVGFYLESCTGCLFDMSGRAWVNKMWCRGSQAGGLSRSVVLSPHLPLADVEDLVPLACPLGRWLGILLRRNSDTRALEGLGGRIGVPEAVAEMPCAWGRRTPWQEEVSLSPVALFLFSLGGSVRVTLRLEVSLASSWPQELWGAGRVEVRFPRPSAGSSSLEMFGYLSWASGCFLWALSLWQAPSSSLIRD